MSTNKNSNVEIYHRINKLKLKAGLPVYDSVHGVIQPKQVQKAQQIIDEKEEEYPIEVKDVLTKLQDSWKSYQESQNEEREEWLEKIYNYSNNVKDLTSMYQHDLMSHFSLSLRDFCEKIDLDKKEHHVIVQAHIDVMWITYEEKLRSDKSEKAEELKKVVAVAISKYS